MSRHHILLLPALFVSCLLAACASTPKNPLEMTEAQRIRAANNGDLKAVLAMQMSYPDKNGKPQPPSKETQLTYLLKAAELGDKDSQYKVAYLSLYAAAPANAAGPAVPYSPVESARLSRAVVSYYCKSMSLQCISDYEIARKAKRLMDKAETIVQQQPLAETGSAAAMYALSQAYEPPDYNGSMSEQGKLPPQYESWLRRAAEAGNVDAASEMSTYASSEGERLAWRKKSQTMAADAGSPHAMFEMGQQFRAKGDNKTALEWYRKAAAKGNAPAQFMIAQLTDATALRLQKSAETGDAEAMYQLAEYFRAGNWAGKDMAQARNWYQAAAKGGNAKAAAWLAEEERQQLAEKQRVQAEADRRQAAEKQRQQQRAEAERLEAEAKYQQQQAFVARIDREGSTDTVTVEQYCKYGGRRCDELRVSARRSLEQRNSAADAANMNRIQNAYKTDKRTEDQRNQDYRNRSECMQKKTESLQKSNSGQQTWHYEGDC